MKHPNRSKIYKFLFGIYFCEWSFCSYNYLEIRKQILMKPNNRKCFLVQFQIQYPVKKSVFWNKPFFHKQSINMALKILTMHHEYNELNKREKKRYNNQKLSLHAKVGKKISPLFHEQHSQLVSMLQLVLLSKRLEYLGNFNKSKNKIKYR